MWVSFSCGKFYLCMEQAFSFWTTRGGFIIILWSLYFSILLLWFIFMQVFCLAANCNSICRHYLIVSAVTNLLVNLIGVWFFRNYARINLSKFLGQRDIFFSLFLFLKFFNSVRILLWSIVWTCFSSQHFELCFPFYLIHYLKSYVLLNELLVGLSKQQICVCTTSLPPKPMPKFSVEI